MNRTTSLRPWLLGCVIAMVLTEILGTGEFAVGQELKEQHAALKKKMAERWNEAKAFQSKGGEKIELKRVNEPVFSFVETAREGSYHLGTLWVWTLTGEPLAILALGRDIDKPVAGYELISLEDDISAVMHDGWEWTPGKSALTLKRLDDAPPAGDTDAARLIQMRALARRFEVVETYNSQTHELRLLPQPFYRYKDATKNIVDGALFNFAHGTNPEALLVLECQQTSEGAKWSYGFVPLAGAEVTARLNGESVWIKPATKGSRLQEPYSTWLETGKN